MKRLLRNPFFWATLAGLMAIPMIRPFLRHVPAAPPVLATLPDFQLVNQEGKPFGSGDLRGRVWVGNFVFTTCRSICPGLTKAMRTLQQRYSDAKVPVQLVSFSVDPQDDTPAVLKSYAQRNGVDLARWTLLTGPEADVRKVIVDGFKTHLGRKEINSDNLVDIAHAPYFVLVDGQGGIRGYYRPDDSGLDEVFHRSQHVLREMRRRGR
jgi:protein SCO1